MKLGVSQFERMAGLFVGAAVGIAILSSIGIALKNEWLADKVTYYTELSNADGLHEGTTVQMAGLRVGSVTSVELKHSEKVRVRLTVLKRFVDKIRADSQIKMYRPFILADKVLEISLGDQNLKPLEPESLIPSQESYDLLDLVSGRHVGTMLTSLGDLAESMRIIGEAFADPKRTRDFVKMVDRLNPLVTNLNTMSKEISRMAAASHKELPDLGLQLAQVVRNLNVLTEEMKKLTPAISEIAPELPRTSRRAVEALDETVVLLKAMQRSFFLRGKVKEVREEEEQRQPASGDDE